MQLQVPHTQKETAKTVAIDITRRLREEIVTCRLKPGSPLRFEQLRLTFEVSFTTLREALTTLVADGLVVTEGQRGYRVAPATLEELADITNARVLIETELLRTSIAKGDDQWEMGIVSALHHLSRIEERLSVNPSEDVAWRAAHKEFHAALVSAGGSPVLLGIRDALFDRSERYRSLSAAHRPTPRDKSGEHRALMLASLNRDADAALKLIEQHFRKTADNVAKYAAAELGQVDRAPPSARPASNLALVPTDSE